MQLTSQASRYLFQTTIIECQNLNLKTIKGQNEIFVKITIANENPQTTLPVKGTTSGEWNQSFSFPNIFLTKEEFLNYHINFEVFLRSPFFANYLIGNFTISINSLYKKMNHEIFNTWLILKKNDNFKNEINGYLKISCFLIGEFDKAPVHTVEENYKNLNVIQEEDFEKTDDLKILKTPEINKKGYKLSVNIVRAEDFPILRMYSVNSFISVRVGSIVLKTPIIENNKNPKYTTRLEFPIFFPLFSDTIIIKAWDKGVPTDLLIANIPEKLKEKDIFNIINIQSQNGHIPFTWINLYGIPKSEKTNFFSKLINKKKEYKEGTAYMGRVLLSLTLNPHENPNKGVHFLKGYNEPENLEYKLFVDIYKANLEIENASVFFGIKFGGLKEIFSKISFFDNKENNLLDEEIKKDLDNKKKVFEWKKNDIFIDEIIGSFPKDIKQVPDIIISLYVKNMFSNSRIGYLRIKPEISINKLPCPKRLKIRSIQNPSNFLGDILLNYKLFLKNEAKIFRMPLKRKKKIKYIFLSYLHSVVELAPFLENGNYKFLFILSFQEFKKEFVVETKNKNFFIEKNIFFELEIENSIEFISDVKLEVFEISENKNTKLINFFNLSKNKNIEIGKLYIPENELTKIKSIKEFDLKPNFYTFIKDNKITGKILANFTLIKSSNKIKEIKSKYAKICEISKSYYKLKISCIGLRNLTKELSNPKIVYKILQNEIILKKTEEKNNIKNFYNINICDSEEINIELPNKFIYWPFINISIYDNFVSNSNLDSNLNCDGNKRIYGVSLPLVYFCDLVSDKFVDGYKEFIGIDFMSEKNDNVFFDFLIKEGVFNEEAKCVRENEKRESLRFQREMKNLIQNLKKKNKISKTDESLSNSFGPNSKIKESLASLKKNELLDSIEEISDSEISLKSIQEEEEEKEEKKNSKINLNGFFGEKEKTDKSEKSDNFEEKLNEGNFDPLFCLDFSKKHLNEENFTS